MTLPPAVTPFNFQSNQIRILEVDRSPWFVAKDVCDILGLENVTNAIQDPGAALSPYSD